MKILNDRNITSSQKGFENIAEGTQYDDYHIDTRGMGILDVENIIDAIESRGNQAVLTVQTSDGSVNHTQFTSDSWKKYKDAVNGMDSYNRYSGKGAAITDVWITEVEGDSYVRSSRRPIKSSYGADSMLSLKGFFMKSMLSNDEKKAFEEFIRNSDFANTTWSFEGWKTIYYNWKNGDYIQSSRRPIKSSKETFEMDSYITGRDHATDFLGFTCDVTKNGDKFEWSNVQSYFDDEDFVDPESRIYGVYDNQEQFLKDVEEFLNSEQGQDIMREEYEKAKENGYVTSSRKITSARYIATDPETGEVLGSADTYEEAVNEWGEDVTITDSEVSKGQEEIGLFQSRRPVNSGMQHKDISNVSPDSWRDGSELPKKNFSNMSIEVFNQDGDEVFYDFEAKQWYYYPTHRKALVKKWVEKNFVNSSCKITSAVDGGWEVRSSDVPKALDLFVEYFGEEDALEQIAKAMGDNTLEENIDYIAQQWGFAEDIEELDDAWDKYETAKEIMGEDQLFDNLTKAAGYDELAEDLAFIFRMNDFREWDEVSGYDDEDEDYNEEYSDFEEKEDITSNRSFPVKTVKNILSGKWSEDYAAECIAQKQDINVGYAKQILSSWIDQYKSKLIKSGVEDETDTLNQDFNIDGDLESWAEQYSTDGSKSDSVGGEMVRAAMQIINRYNADGDMIGRGYGNESVNPAARYLTEKAEMGVNEQIQSWLDHEERADDYEYDDFLGKLRSEVESILRENPELFQKPNSDDYWSWKTDDDLQYSFDRCYIDDGEGTQYWFEKGDDDRWVCTEIEVNPNRTYSEGDTISDGDEFIDEIDPTEEFGSFEAEGLIYEYAGDEWNDKMEQYTSWQITKVIPTNAYCDEGDTFDYYDLEPDSILGYTLYDDDGIEIDERTFLANSLIKSRFGAGSECVIEIDRHKNNKWEMVAESDDERGWTLNGTAKMFADKNEAKNSDLMKALERSGYSVNKGNLKISEA